MFKKGISFGAILLTLVITFGVIFIGVKVYSGYNNSLIDTTISINENEEQDKSEFNESDEEVKIDEQDNYDEYQQKVSEIIKEKGALGLSIALVEDKIGMIDSIDENVEEDKIIVENDMSIEGKYNHDEYQEKIDKVAKEYGAVGVSVALIEDGKVIDTFSYGNAIKGKLKMSEDTKVRAASVSKVLLGIATMISVENGKISLDEDIGTYWGFKIGTHVKGDKITARSLLTHTSSLYDSEETSDTYYNAMVNRLKGSGIKYLISGDIKNHYYNNYAMDVLGMTIELANNKKVDDILSERIYNDLGIDAAFYSGDLKNTSNIATIYQSDGSIGLDANRIKKWYSGKPGSVGWGFAGGATISVKDLGKIVALISNGGMYDGKSYLSDVSINNLEYHEGNDTGKYWQCQPLFYETDKYGQEEFYYHDGSAYGVLSLIGYNPVTKQGIAVLTTGASKENDICGDIAEILLNIKV